MLKCYPRISRATHIFIVTVRSVGAILFCPKILRTLTLATGQWRKLPKAASCSDLGEESLPHMFDL